MSETKFPHNIPVIHRSSSDFSGVSNLAERKILCEAIEHRPFTENSNSNSNNVSVYENRHRPSMLDSSKKIKEPNLSQLKMTLSCICKPNSRILHQNFRRTLITRHTLLQITIIKEGIKLLPHTLNQAHPRTPRLS